ncbi:MAG: hypothetical protein HYU63_06745 [Armatimonadetes bacterium]|nr:hypothetical protein [Armatimonadota bacterium]
MKETFFDGYKSHNYSAKWDVPAEHNLNYGRIPVSIKTAKYPTSIGLGDAIRQFETDQDFLFIVGFWSQEADFKRIVNVSHVTVKKDLWRSLWGCVTYEALKELDNLIKNTNLHYFEARSKAQQLKRIPPLSQCPITLNPKIDSKTQRRLQCSIGFDLFFKKIAVGFSDKAVKEPTLWGVNVPPPWTSGSRKFNR